MRKDKIGKMGEIESTRFFRDNGYKILNVNYRTRFGEIDIICTKGNYIVFAEVKTRGEGSIAAPREFVDHNKQSKIINTAMIYLSANKINLQPRFDVVEVYHNKNDIKINHIKNAFGG